MSNYKGCPNETRSTLCTGTQCALSKFHQNRGVQMHTSVAKLLAEICTGCYVEAVSSATIKKNMSKFCNFFMQYRYYNSDVILFRSTDLNYECSSPFSRITSARLFYFCVYQLFHSSIQT